MTVRRVAVVGGSFGTTMGASLDRAAIAHGHASLLIDSAGAFGSGVLQKLQWWIGGRRPQYLEAFSRHAVDRALKHRATHLIATGIAPLDVGSLRELSAQGVRTACFLTDDPFNAVHRARWFFDSVTEYDLVLTPRGHLIGQLRSLPLRRVERMLFGFDAGLFSTGSAVEPVGAPDVLFVGTGDRDRVAYLAALRSSGVALLVYGKYYERWAATRGMSGGEAGPAEIRTQTCAAKVCVCLVRRANRDGHVMRSLEMAACGACMLVEDTADHRELFGADGDCVRYFNTPQQMLEVLAELLGDQAARLRLRARTHARIMGGDHTYADRLAAILAMLDGTGRK